MPGKIKNWLSSRRVFNKIDYMSLNRLRLNQSISSTLPVRLSYAEKTRRADNLIWVRSHDTSITFDNLTLIRNPYGVTPLTALAIFHTDNPCRLSYTLHSDAGAEDFHYDYHEMTTSHVAPIWGMYADTLNIITLTLYREDGSKLASRVLECQTEALPSDYTYPVFCDKRGNIRYILTIPTQNEQLYPLPNGHFLLINDKMRTRTGAEPLPTHIHEIDLLGRNYRTCYVGNGIQQVYNTSDADKHLLLITPSPEGEDSLLTVIDWKTGAVLRTIRDFTLENAIQPTRLTYSFFEVFCDSQENFVAAGEELEHIEYAETGWLQPPVLYKAASVESSGAVSLDDMKEKYDLTFSIVGNNLSIDTTSDDIQEIVFSRADRLYELDLTNPPLADEQYAKYRYTLAVPFTEMYSGTYSIVIRFRDGGQAVLQDTVTLSREHST